MWSPIQQGTSYLKDLFQAQTFLWKLCFSVNSSPSFMWRCIILFPCEKGHPFFSRKSGYGESLLHENGLCSLWKINHNKTLHSNSTIKLYTCIIIQLFFTFYIRHYTRYIHAGRNGPLLQERIKDKNIFKNMYIFFLMLFPPHSSSYNVFLESFGLGKVSVNSVSRTT